MLPLLEDIQTLHTIQSCICGGCSGARIRLSCALTRSRTQRWNAVRSSEFLARQISTLAERITRFVLSRAGAWGYSLPYSEYMRAAFARRARLVPLIYTSLHDFEATGVSPLHPVYYDAPQAAGAYEYLDTYIYCDHLLVAPITAPQHNTTQLAERKLWLPPGAWVDTVSGTEITSKAGVEITRS